MVAGAARVNRAARLSPLFAPFSYNDCKYCQFAETHGMPIHNWTSVDAGIFHDFHHESISTIKHAVNRHLKGTEYYALAERIAGGVVPDVLTLQYPSSGKKRKKPAGQSTQGGIALADSPPQARFRITNIPQWYATKKKAVTIRHVSEHHVVAVLEILSPGNKATASATRNRPTRTLRTLRSWMP